MGLKYSCVYHRPLGDDADTSVGAAQMKKFEGTITTHSAAASQFYADPLMDLRRKDLSPSELEARPLYRRTITVVLQNKSVTNGLPQRTAR